MATPILAAAPCVACGTRSARIELPMTTAAAPSAAMSAGCRSTGQSGSAYSSGPFRRPRVTTVRSGDHFSDRLLVDQARRLHHIVDVGEYGLVLEDLAAKLVCNKITVTPSSGPLFLLVEYRTMV